MVKITEQPSPYRHLEKKSVSEITALINNEDKKVAEVIQNALPHINQLIEVIVKAGGRMFYLGTGSCKKKSNNYLSQHLIGNMFRE